MEKHFWVWSLLEINQQLGQGVGEGDELFYAILVQYCELECFLLVMVDKQWICLPLNMFDAIMYHL